MTFNEAAQVECYSGYVYAQRPRAFVWEGKRIPVLSVEAEWRTPEERNFRVLAEGGSVYHLAYTDEAASWKIDLIASACFIGDTQF